MTTELPARLTALIKLQRECFQRQHEAIAEAEADFESKVEGFEAVAGAGTADEAGRVTNPLGGQTQRTQVAKSEQPTRPEPLMTRKADDSYVKPQPPIQQGALLEAKTAFQGAVIRSAQAAAGIHPFDSLPWKTNKAQIQWVFANAAGAEGLVAKIGTLKGTVYIDGGWKYRLTGDHENARKFINREKAK